MSIYFWALYSAQLIYISVFIPIPCCFGYFSFVVLSDIREHNTSHFVLFLKISVVIQNLVVLCNLRISCSSSEKSLDILIGVVLNLCITLGSKDIFNNIKENDDIINLKILLWKLELIYAKHLEQILASIKHYI